MVPASRYDRRQAAAGDTRAARPCRRGSQHIVAELPDRDRIQSDPRRRNRVWHVAWLGQRGRVLYSEGCKITIGGSWQQDEVTPSDPEEDRKQIAEAVKVARRADVIVLAIGGNEQTSREARWPTPLGDRPSLDLVGRQEELVKAMLATGKPVVVVLFNGRPISINYVSQNVPARSEEHTSEIQA